MGIDPQGELAKLAGRIEAARERDDLKPLLIQLNEIVKKHPDDFDLQVAASEIKERLLERGRELKKQFGDTTWSESPSVPLRSAPTLPLAEPTEPVEQPGPTRGAPAVIAKPKAFRTPALMVMAGMALVIAILAILTIATKRKSPGPSARGAAGQLQVATEPAGASVHITGASSETDCISDCKLSLAPGNYEVTARLDGFEPAAGNIQVDSAHAAAVRLTLRPQSLTVRLLTDLDKGKVTVDDQPAVDLQEGQLVLDKLAPGSHTVKIAGNNREASFSFEVADARLPVVAGPVRARNLVAVLVASFGQQARVVTSGGPWKLAVNGQPQDDAKPAGTDLTNFKAGVDEIVVGEGKDRHNIIETFPAYPMLTVFLKSDVNAGTLIVSAGQDDVRVFLNGKEYRGRTKRGQLRIQTLGPVAVRVAKSGFQDEPPQNVEVKRGEEVRVQFDLKPQPQVGSLEMRGAPAGAEVWVDQRVAGTVGPDGSFSLSGVQPGDRTIELRRDQYVPKKFQRAFRAGQTVTLAGADVVLAAATGAIRFIHNVPATITYRRGGESESHEVRGDQIELPVGTYALAASAPGFGDAALTVKLSAGDSKEVEFKMKPVPVAPPPPTPAGMTDFEDAATWKREGDVWVRKGGGFSLFKPSPRGVFTFTVELLKGGTILRPGQVRWCVQYLDSRNYLLFEMDRRNFWAGVIQSGKRFERVKSAHGQERQKGYTIQIEVTRDSMVTSVRGSDEWRVLDTFTEPGRDFTQGKFGFLIPGNDEIAISDFKFVPR